MLFAILSSSVTLTRINFVHIINYFSCFIKQWSHKIHLQNLMMSLLFPTILRGGWASWWTTSETISSNLVSASCEATDILSSHESISPDNFLCRPPIPNFFEITQWYQISKQNPKIMNSFYTLYIYYYSADDTTTNTRQQNLIVQLTIEDIWGSAVMKRESQNIMRGVQHQDLSSVQQEVMQKQRMWFCVNNPGIYTNAMM